MYSLLWVVLVLHGAVLIAGIIDLRLQFFVPVLWRNPESHSALALTFDDGPDPNLTPAILDLLDRFNYKATFFVVARRVEQYPQLAVTIVRRGHTIACHDLDHRPTGNFRSNRQMLREIDQACTIIQTITGKRPSLYRPPVGLSNPHLRPVLETLHLTCIGWSGSVRDGGNRFIHRLSRMQHLAVAGTVVLLHDTLPNPKHRQTFLTHLEELLVQMENKHLASVDVNQFFTGVQDEGQS